MKVKIETSDQELVVRIPVDLAKQVDITSDSVVNAFVEHGTIVLQKQGYQRKKYSLTELCDQITDENRHEVVDWGPAVGKEIW